MKVYDNCLNITQKTPLGDIRNAVEVEARSFSLIPSVPAAPIYDRFERAFCRSAATVKMRRLHGDKNLTAVASFARPPCPLKRRILGSWRGRFGDGMLREYLLVYAWLRFYENKW